MSLKVKYCIEFQKKLTKKINFKNVELLKVRTIAGCDVTIKEGYLIAGFAVFTFPTLKLIDIQISISKITFPYIPGLLAFRELPSLLKAYYKLHQKPDVILCDGHGISHMRKMGIATMLGIKLQKSVIGCAKKKLFGNFSAPKKVRSFEELRIDQKKIIGYVYKSKKGCNPIFISVGNMITLSKAKAIILKTFKNHKLPEPIRYIHNFLSQVRKIICV